MPLLSVVAVRLALVNLVLGFGLGALLMAGKGLPGPLMGVPGGIQGHIACVMYGWALQLAIGVSFWILPRFLEGPPRGDERPAWVAIGLLNLGIVFALLGHTTALHALEGAAALAYARHIVPRIRPYLLPR